MIERDLILENEVVLVRVVAVVLVEFLSNGLLDPQESRGESIDACHGRSLYPMAIHKRWLMPK